MAVTGRDHEGGTLATAPTPGKPVREIGEFLAWSPSGALLGLDPGKRRIGIAASDATRMIAGPVEVMVRGRWADDIERLGRLAAGRGITGIVLGFPLNMDGSEGPRARSAWQTGINLDRGLALPVLMWDERLSTFEAEEILGGRGLSRERRAARLDAVAACVILRDALGALERFTAEGVLG